MKLRTGVLVALTGLAACMAAGRLDSQERQSVGWTDHGGGPDSSKYVELTQITPANVQVITDSLPVVRHVHMKDFNGGPHYLGYCRIGQGKVDVAGVAALLESSGNELMIMCELDPSAGQPHTPLEAARINTMTMAALGYTFRT